MSMKGMITTTVVTELLEAINKDQVQEGETLLTGFGDHTLKLLRDLVNDYCILLEDVNELKLKSNFSQDEVEWEDQDEELMWELKDQYARYESELL